MSATSAPRGARRWRLALRASVCLLSATLLAGCGTSGGSAIPPAPGCAQHDGLPDPRCTPGAIRPGVTLAAICAFGYSRAVRPPESFTEPLKLAQMRAYRLPGSPSDYEEDHLVPLSIGGAPRDPRNLWPEPRAGPISAEHKDRLETWAARMACAHRIPLSRLQHGMASDWIALYRAAGGERMLLAYPTDG
ncbi:MAG TPA: hypothetical protein VK538_00195 [Solirubrobacteraceae bacterium]|nr:hypothetical protein [Solirubrobacteraceae bacterium]